MVALNASFMAYQATTEVASTQTIGRLTMTRMLSLIRTGKEFGPYPSNSLDTTVTDDFIQFKNPNGQLIELRWDQPTECLYVSIDGGTENLLLEGVKPQYRPLSDPVDPGGLIHPFTLEYEKGRSLYRATIDMLIKPDDNMSVEMDGNNEDTIRLVASAMPRLEAY